MKKNITPFLIPAFSLIIFFWSCKKSGSSEDSICEQIQKVKITGAKSSYFVGDTIELTTNMVPLGLYLWTHGDIPNSISNDETVFIYSCTKGDEGWYYLDVSYPGCAQRYDSVYIQVINRPVSAPCNPANNTVSFSAIPNISFSTTSWTMDPVFECKTLRGYYASGYPDFNIYFNFYWNTREPEDGEYNLSSKITFDDYDPYSVFIASTYSDIYFKGGPGKVYVSHVNGKLKVDFCDIPLSGSIGGPAFTTTATGNLTTP